MGLDCYFILPKTRSAAVTPLYSVPYELGAYQEMPRVYHFRGRCYFDLDVPVGFELFESHLPNRLVTRAARRMQRIIAAEDAPPPMLLALASMFGFFGHYGYDLTSSW